jgi:hypothetical protein
MININDKNRCTFFIASDFKKIYWLDGFGFSAAVISFNDSEFIQYLKPLGAGPSGNTCPR